MVTGGESKIFVLDTSAIMTLVQDVTTFREGPAFATVLGDNEIVIPRVVLDELDKLRHGNGEKSKIALEAARQLEYYTSQGSLLEGVETEKGGTLRIAPRPTNEKVIAWGLKANVADHEILATAMECEDELRAKNPDYDEDGARDGGATGVVLITQDRILRILARSIYGVQAEELKSVCAPDFEDHLGYYRVETSGEEIDQVIAQGYYTPERPCRVNEFFHLVDSESPDVHYCYLITRDSKRADLIDRTKIDYLKVSGEVSGRNIRQKLLLWALMGCGESDPSAPGGVRLITVCGPPGSGKSFLALAAAWERLERGHFDRIVITRPMVEIGTSLGFLPGTLEEKLQPWGGLIEDNLRAIVQVPTIEEGRGGSGAPKKGLQRSVRPFDAKSWLEMENRLELIPLAYIRGRTFRRSFVILEEAQNIEKGPLKVLLTRLGEGSIVVVIGDPSQIDNQFLSRRNNGLVHAVNAFRDWPQAININLEQIVRSDLAEAASSLL